MQEGCGRPFGKRESPGKFADYRGVLGSVFVRELNSQSFPFFFAGDVLLFYLVTGRRRDGDS